MTKEKWYKLFVGILRPFVKVFLPQRVIGAENIPEGPALICANHSNAADPVIISVGIGGDVYIHHFAKAESRSTPVFGWMMTKIGSIFVKRGERDIDSFKQCLRALKSGEKIMVFPEGTRVHGADTVGAKTGVIHMAVKTHTPIVPAYLPRDKKPFQRYKLVFGKPYYVDVTGHDDYSTAAEELMERIWSLKD